MTTTQIRKAVHKRIDRIDDQFLNVVHAMLEAYSNGEDYTKPGKPMSLTTLKSRLRKAEERIDSGTYTTQEALEKEIQRW